MDEINENIIELIDDEGNTFRFSLIEAFEIEGQKYAILAPVDEAGEEALVLKVAVDENGEEYLYEIDDDEEWQMVAQVWEALDRE